MKQVEILKFTTNDIGRLQQISRQTFTETFASVNSTENMKKYLDEEFSIEKLLSELSDGNSEFYFATYDKDVVGYLKLNFGQAQTELQSDLGVEIERIYVLREFQGKNLGQDLFNKALEIAGNKNADYIWLGVWEENLKAIKFYERNGFQTFDKHLFKLGSEMQTDLMMKLAL
ncbi:MAG: GNAT family N-acetyltransferase [Saprospiraceae bacterium]|nr:GNAT family N-acetyltransferase [Saprospiraceae bacterium]